MVGQKHPLGCFSFRYKLRGIFIIPQPETAGVACVYGATGIHAQWTKLIRAEIRFAFRVVIVGAERQLPSRPALLIVASCGLLLIAAERQVAYTSPSKNMCRAALHVRQQQSHMG